MTSARKTPQDKKPSQKEVQEALQKDFNEVEGSEHIVPFSKIKGTDQMRIIGRMRSLGIGDDDTESDINFEEFADFVDWIGEKYTVDQEKFEAWSAGPGGMVRTLKLATALLGELGKGMGSTES